MHPRPAGNEPSEPWIYDPTAASLLAYVRAEGGDPSDLERRIDAAASDRSPRGIRLPASVARELYDRAAHQLREPLTGVRLAQRLQRGVLGIAEFAASASPDLREALARAARYIRLISGPSALVTLEERDDDATFAFHLPAAPESMGRQVNEMMMAHWLRMTEHVLPSLKRSRLEIHFTHPVHDRAAELGRRLGTRRLVFGAPVDGIVFPRPYLDAPLRTADPPLLEILDGLAEQALAEEPAPSLIARVGLWIEIHLARGTICLEAVAAAVGLTPRTLQHQLAEQGTTFHALLEAARREQALELLRRVPGATLRELARRLAYADDRAFVRAFRRWTGTSPRRWSRSRG